LKKSYIKYIVILVILFTVLTIILIKKNSKKIIWNSKNSLSITKERLSKDSGNSSSLLNAIDNSLKYLKKKKPDEIVNFGKDEFTFAEIISSIEDFKENLKILGLSEEFFNYVNSHFIFYKSNADKVLFTGYYEAGLEGSYEKNEIYRYPIYGRPKDLVKIDLTKFSFYKEGTGIPKVLKGRLTEDKRVIPFFSREEIDNEGKLNDLGLEILFVKDPVNLFFLQIQGSGIVKLENGEVVRVNYSESNGHRYSSIGKYLVDKGYIGKDNISMQSIREFLKNNPDKIDEVFSYNQSYVFFRTVKDGPIGSIGVPLTQFRSIATDRYVFPRGALCFIRTEIPVFNENEELTGWKDYYSFVMNQDTGGAIRSPGRVDIFTGYGKAAELTAGYMKRYGELFFLIKKK